ncbi:cation-transporting ATPase 13A2 [Pelomyxa schiedti]|nr:cation-transporting ATPase 13A2 [Pelomyxa schiedti]
MLAIKSRKKPSKDEVAPHAAGSDPNDPQPSSSSSSEGERTALLSAEPPPRRSHRGHRSRPPRHRHHRGGGAGAGAGAGAGTDSDSAESSQSPSPPPAAAGRARAPSYGAVGLTSAARPVAPAGGPRGASSSNWVNELADATGYRRCTPLMVLFVLCSVCTVGILPLVCWWFPAVFVRLTSIRCELSEATTLLVWGVDGEKIPKIAHVRVVPKSSEDSSEAQPLRLAIFRCFRYLFNFETDKFERVEYNVNFPFSTVHRNLPVITRTSVDIYQNTHIYGPCQIEIPMKSIPRLFVDEMLHPFFVFQMFSCVLWFFEEYYLYSMFILVASLSSAFANMYQIRVNMNKFVRMVTCNFSVTKLTSKKLMDTASGVITNDYHFQEETVDSSAILPGDLISLSEDTPVLPCDLLLLSGYAIMNEGSLTGESTPVLKSPLPIFDEAENYNPDSMSKYTIYGGTTLLCAKRVKEFAIGLVIRTGYSTSKGLLMQSILHPPPTRFTFQTDSLKYIGILFLISLGGFIYSFYLYFIHGADASTIIIRGLDLVTIIVPPALPLALTIGTLNALSRLTKEHIFCTSPKRVNEAGKVQLMTFDKTGTLTEDGLEVVGVIPSLPLDGDYTDYLSPTGTPPHMGQPVTDTSLLSPGMTATLTCCHSLGLLGKQLIGDPLDVKMVQFIGWKMSEVFDGDGHTRGMTTVLHPQEGKSHLFSSLSVLKRFEFSPTLQRQVVVARGTHPEHTSTQLLVVAKGAPEVVLRLCQRKTVPDDFEQTLAQYASQGYRLIACASKCLREDQFTMKMARELVENDLEFQGLLVLNNPLKPESAPTIRKLACSRIRSVMATGDNLQTAVCVAQLCGILRKDIPIFLGEVRGGDVVWAPLESGPASLNPLTLLPSDGTQLFQLAMTGDAFQFYLQQKGPLLDKILVRGQVFARMKPDMKKELVECFEDIGYFTGMCGDGTNDCGALKAARVGLSLSESEASIAAPFTCTVPNIKPVLTLLSEGRCALCTAFGLFKFIAGYALLQFSDVVLLYYFYCNLSDMDFLYQDLCLTIVLSFGMSKTIACKKLSQRRPTSNLVSASVLTSLLGVIAIQVGLMAGCFLLAQEQNWWIAPIVPEGATYLNTYPTAVVSLFSSLEFPTMALVWSLGWPFMMPPIYNLYLIGGLVFCVALNLFLLFQNFDWLCSLFDLPYGDIPSSLSALLSSLGSSLINTGENPPPIPTTFRYIMVAIAAAGFFITILYELTVRNWIPALFGNTRRYNPRRFKKYQLVEQEIYNRPGKKIPDLHCNLS